MVKEGDPVTIEGTAVRDTVERRVSRVGNSDHVNIPSSWRKFLKKKVQISILQKEKVFGKYVLVIEWADET